VSDGFWDDIDDLDDDALLALLSEAASSTDPVPDEVIAFAKMAPSIIGLDVGLATLIDESELSAAGGLRHGGGARRYRFDLDGTIVRVDLLGDLVLGEYDAAGWEAEVVYTAGREPAPTAELMFEFEPRQNRFALSFTSGQRCLATEWLRA
jgi:hypothetical protein